MDTRSAIRTTAKLGEHKQRIFFFLLLFLFLPHLIIFEPLQSPIESLGAVLFPGP